ncbi:hypothetical protein KZZ52_40210 [Dactylosporangium sp. AC04546]|uniref:hypothetical protein n=1 Tax=Dactylosporangium sp. AC04546 TaxID=2862460 RepID=UPI001EDDB521|nr:hypothetical protein [Dactylosporangium sp. AC04546]WVK80172.1 hypothetical protein KZZ52_40210 [Dactylosporangium sp. AC04546]
MWTVRAGGRALLRLRLPSGHQHALALGAAGLRALPPELRVLAGFPAGGRYVGFVGGAAPERWVAG